MANFNLVDLIDLVECYAECNDRDGLILNEDDLSKRFDEDIMPIILAEYGEPGVEFSDFVMIDEAFNNWADSLCNDGLLHEEQCNNYCYVGEWS